MPYHILKAAELTFRPLKSCIRKYNSFSIPFSQPFRNISINLILRMITVLMNDGQCYCWS